MDLNRLNKTELAFEPTRGLHLGNGAPQYRKHTGRCGFGCNAEEAQDNIRRNICGSVQA